MACVGGLCSILRLQTKRVQLLSPPMGLLLTRGKKKPAKKQKSKKEVQRELMKDFIKKRELEQLLQNAALKAAKKGEPFDPEMLNPARKREKPVITTEERERRILLVKTWSRYRIEKHKQEHQFLQGMLKSRENALSELKKVSPSLYDQALELNPKLFPFKCTGPTYTPPITAYVPPDPES